jgi:peptidoglycan/LPS O-acetylase OafA/YrhL
MFVIVPLLFPAEGKTVFERSSPWWAFPLYLQNFLVPTPEKATGLLGVTWSLAIEEQFYLVWPLIVRFCSTLLLRWIALSVVCLSPVLRLFLSYAGVDLYSNTFSRLDGLMAGALLAILIRSTDFVPSRFLGKAWMALCIATPLAFLTEAVHARWIVFSMSGAASVSLVYLALYSGQKWLQGALGTGSSSTPERSAMVSTCFTRFRSMWEQHCTSTNTRFLRRRFCWPLLTGWRLSRGLFWKSHS